MSRLEGQEDVPELTDDVASDLRSGVILWLLVETLDGGKPVALTRKGVAARPSKILAESMSEQSGKGTKARAEASHNVQRVLQKMKEMGLYVGVAARDIVDGEKPKEVLSVVYAITRRAMQLEGNAKKMSVLRWAATRAAGITDEQDLVSELAGAVKEGDEEEDEIDDEDMEELLNEVKRKREAFAAAKVKAAEEAAKAEEEAAKVEEEAANASEEEDPPLEERPSMIEVDELLQDDEEDDLLGLTQPPEAEQEEKLDDLLFLGETHDAVLGEPPEEEEVAEEEPLPEEEEVPEEKEEEEARVEEEEVLPEKEDEEELPEKEELPEEEKEEVPEKEDEVPEKEEEEEAPKKKSYGGGVMLPGMGAPPKKKGKAKVEESTEHVRVMLPGLAPMPQKKKKKKTKKFVPDEEEEGEGGGDDGSDSNRDEEKKKALTPQEEDDAKEADDIPSEEDAVFTIKNLDTGDVLEATPEIVLGRGGIVGDDNAEARHRYSLNLWHGITGIAVPTWTT